VLAADQQHRIAVSATPLNITPDKAVSIGVIVNELITNALKYAFPHGKAGIIEIDLRVADETVILSVKDNGVGYEAEATQPKGTGLGTLIIGAMAKTLRGTIAQPVVETGSQTVLTFPLD
jgi:two-component sensor histidine kinase